jgi:putative ABC transport system permease protein
VITATPVQGRPGFFAKWRTMARVAVRMMFHDRLKFLGTLAGVIFAVLLSNQQAAVFLGLVDRNVMFVEHAGADLWILPASTETLQPGKMVSDASLMQARVTDGVAWAEPLLFGGATVALPSGGSEPVQLVGTRAPAFRGGPWNVVAGDAQAIARPGTMIFEDSERAKLGGLNLGSVREVNGHQVQAGGFTWGLSPFGPSYAFAEYDTAREVLRTPRDQESFVLVGLAPGVDARAVQKDLQARLPEVKVMTKADFEKSIISYVILRTGIGVTFGTSTIFGLFVGFVIVSLSMFSAVVDNVREFGTLKAIGATTWDLGRVLWIQAILYALIGSLVGLALVSQLASAARSPQMAMQLPPVLLGGTAVMMVVLCIVASTLSLLRVRAVEPAMVFR